MMKMNQEDWFDDDGFCRKEINGKHGFIWSNGEWLIEPIYDRLNSDFDEEGFCRAQIEGNMVL